MPEIPEKCPWCQSERKTVFLATDFNGDPFPCEVRSWNCNSGWSESGIVSQSHCCREECLNRKLAIVTAERDILAKHIDFPAAGWVSFHLEGVGDLKPAINYQKCTFEWELPDGRRAGSILKAIRMTLLADKTNG